MTPVWIGVDFDGTLCTYDAKQYPALGRPVKLMVERVKNWLARGLEVRVVTARAFHPEPGELQRLEAWCLEHVGVVLPVTCCKDFDMVELWDDRAVQVERNTGRTLVDAVEPLAQSLNDVRKQLNSDVEHLYALGFGSVLE